MMNYERCDGGLTTPETEVLTSTEILILEAMRFLTGCSSFSVQNS